METLIKKLMCFENGSETVESFNVLFPECNLLGFSNESIVTIKDPCTPETVRMIEIDGTEFRHDFKPVKGETYAINYEVL